MSCLNGGMAVIMPSGLGVCVCGPAANRSACSRARSPFALCPPSHIRHYVLVAAASVPHVRGHGRGTRPVPLVILGAPPSHTHTHTHTHTHPAAGIVHSTLAPLSLRGVVNKQPADSTRRTSLVLRRSSAAFAGSRSGTLSPPASRSRRRWGTAAPWGEPPSCTMYARRLHTRGAVCVVFLNQCVARLSKGRQGGCFKGHGGRSLCLRPVQMAIACTGPGPALRWLTRGGAELGHGDANEAAER